MTKYEILYIIRPNIDEEAKAALVERFDGILTDNGAANLESKDLLTKSMISAKVSTTSQLLKLKQLQKL